VVAAGRSITEIRAELHDLQVQCEESDDDAAAANEAPSEPDPIDEPPPVEVAPAAPPTSDPSLEALKAKLKDIGRRPASKSADPATPAAQEASAPAEAPVDAEDSLLMCRPFFSDDLWALIEGRQPVKLNATIDRKLHRQQSNLLREHLDYEFEFLDQTFYPL
jgi:hypothetical protein